MWNDEGKRYSKCPGFFPSSFKCSPANERLHVPGVTEEGADPKFSWGGMPEGRPYFRRSVLCWEAFLTGSWAAGH